MIEVGKARGFGAAAKRASFCHDRPELGHQMTEFSTFFRTVLAYCQLRNWSKSVGVVCLFTIGVHDLVLKGGLILAVL